MTRHRRELSLVIAILALSAVLAAVAPGFFTPGNLRDLLIRQVHILSFVSICVHLWPSSLFSPERPA